MAYKVGVNRSDPNLLLNIAKYESNNNLMPGIVAGDILSDAYSSAKSRGDYRTLYKIANFEAEKNLMPYTSADTIRREARNIEYGY